MNRYHLVAKIGENRERFSSFLYLDIYCFNLLYILCYMRNLCGIVVNIIFTNSGIKLNNLYYLCIRKQKKVISKDLLKVS